MGQKIHPLGFRVGITKSYQSQWFARFHKHQYAQTILEDRLLRENLLKLFPQLLNPVLKKEKKPKSSPELSTQITQIKIERGLIPYEIGIQIHAENCEFIKPAIDHLEIDQNLLHNLQKNRRYLLDLKNQLKKQSFSFQKDSDKKLSLKASFGQPLFGKKNVNKRKTSFQYRQSLLSNIMILKKGKKITRQLKKKFYTIVNPNKDYVSTSLKQGKGNFQNRQTTRSKYGFSGQNQDNQKSRDVNSRYKDNKKFTKQKFSQTNITKKTLLVSSFGQSPKTRTFVDMFVSKMSQKFVNILKKKMSEWNRFMKTHKENQKIKYGQPRFAPLGYQRKWSLTRLKRLQKQPLNLLNKLLKSLQKKAFKKMEMLQKQFAVLGTISKIESFNYYQMVRFIKALKQLVKQLRMEQSVISKQQFNRASFDKNPEVQQKLEKTLLSLTEKALTQKFNNIDNECRKIKFIDYLQKIVKKHRQKNIYLYLSTISDSRKYLRKIQNYTKQQAGSLFGIDLNTLRQYSIDKQREILTNKVSKAFKQASRKNQFEKNVKDLFLKQMEKQRIMCINNIELTPKISIKFYSVKAKNIKTNAFLIADSIVDDLEKRKAFRGVIKKAKDQLMANFKVKGVKIQVSGRLNGAEIARSEWVRAGRVPLQTLRANIDYCYKTANTIYGIIGVKVWIYKGYTNKRRLL
jgi:ribosomal protein S3